MMECQDSRKRLYLSKSSEVVSEDLTEASRHVRECQECREFIEGERRFSSLLKGAFRKDETPPELKERILGQTNGGKGMRKVFQRTTIAASILTLLTLGVMLGHFIFTGNNASIISDIVDEHIQFLHPSNMQIQSSIPEEVRAWFSGKIDFNFSIPDLAARLKGGRLCFLKKKRVALLFYEHQDSQISLFISHNMDIKRLKQGKEVMLEGKRAYLSEDRGYRLLAWEEGGVNYVLVSELGINEIQGLI